MQNAHAADNFDSTLDHADKPRKASAPPTGWTGKFGLPQNPFKDTLDTDLFYRTRQHEEAVVKTRIGIEDHHALILLSGASGTGKTLISQVVMQTMDLARYVPVFVSVHPGMGKGSLLAAILRELEVELLGRTTSERVAQLQNIALVLHEQEQRLVIIIDEAHFLKTDALHLLRTLSNLETEKDKLVTVLLVAEDSLRKRLASPSYASLKGRITFMIQLAPLTPQETEQMVKYRLLKCKAPLKFIDADTFAAVHRFSQGVPREINRLLYNGFVEAMSTGQQQITGETITLAAAKLGLVQQADKH